jgi:hypothetical protein
VLNYQTQLKYPNGRWVNEPLQNAWKKITASKSLTLSEQSAVDSAMCALKILDRTIGSPTDTAIPHGAIIETAFLDARQIKAIDKPASIPGTYDLDVELRQPLEIRATVLDLDLLRRKSRTNGEFLFPNSGIIYATRDDALPDDSESNNLDVSATDFKLDPTRRPNAIMLINGSNLSRNASYKPEEKGFILASNLPVYIKGDFNVHTQEEFTGYSLKGEKNWSNKFYARQLLNPNFACRQGQFSGCDTGESWRSAVVIADAITVLSDNFRFGFREEGNYELRNNYDTNSEAGIIASTATKKNGFWDNNFVTSFPWKDNNSSYGNPTGLNGNPIKSSYFNNFVTPIQRRVLFPEYLMEICRKPTVAACGLDNWSVGYATGGAVDWDYKATDSGTKRILPSFTVDTLGAGTTARPALNPADRRYPRRVAFLRDSTGRLILTGTAPNLKPIPLGIKGSDNPTAGSTDDNNGQINYYPYTTTSIAGISYTAYGSTNRPRLHENALWFQTANDSSTNYGYNYPLSIANPSAFTIGEKTDQPLLIPILQIQYPFTVPADSSSLIDTRDVKNSGNWMQTATNTETNLIFAQGNIPGRPNETNGGLENFVRYLERWQGMNHTVAGSFIQFKRSNYATAPWQTLIGTNTSGQTLGRTPFFTPPNRFWSYDVALLGQLPDLFAQRFTTPTTKEPSEFYREVGRDDAWVKTLLCAAQDGNVGGYDNARSIYGNNFKYAVSQDQRGTCP